MTTEVEYQCNNCGHEGIITRAAPDVPELGTVGHLWECAEYYMEERGWYGYIKLITEESPSHHVSPSSKIRSHRELVTRDQAAAIIDSLSMLLNNKQADCDQKDAIIAAKDKEIERLRKKLRQEFQLGLTTLERAEAAEAKLTEIKAQEPVLKMVEHPLTGTNFVHKDSTIPVSGDYKVTPLYAAPVDQSAEIERLREALTKLSSPTQTAGLLWWQVEARAALNMENKYT